MVCSSTLSADLLDLNLSGLVFGSPSSTPLSDNVLADKTTSSSEGAAHPSPG
jgi:hypothetical protein